MRKTDVIKQVAVQQTRQVKAIEHGTVLDHVPVDKVLEVARIIGGPDDEVLIGINFPSKRLGRKGVVKISGRELPDHVLSQLAIITPEATVCLIRDFSVVSKEPIQVPKYFRGLCRCPNSNCISNDECSGGSDFTSLAGTPLQVRCRYCERTFLASELTLAPR